MSESLLVELTKVLKPWLARQQDKREAMILATNVLCQMACHMGVSIFRGELVSVGDKQVESLAAVLIERMNEELIDGRTPQT